MRTKKSRYLLLFVIIVLVLAILITHHIQQKKRALAEARAATPVLVSYPIKKTINNAISIVGTVVASQQTYIAPKISGYIAKIFFTEGQYVKAGTALIQLDDTKIQVQVHADAVAYQIDKKRFELDQLLFKKGLIVKQDMENAQAEMEVAFVTLTQDKQLLDQTILRAPFNGYLGAKNVSIGDYVNPAQQLVLLVDRDNLEVQYNVQEKYAELLRLGQTITLKGQSNPAKVMTAVIEYIAPNIDNASRTIAVHAKIQGAQPELLPGQYVVIKQALSAPEAGLFIPEQAVIPSLDGEKIFIVVNGQAKSIMVQVGQHHKGLVQITKGLAANQVVVVEGQERLHDGQAVSTQFAPKDLIGEA